jgi:hypothetical protein
VDYSFSYVARWAAATQSSWPRPLNQRMAYTSIPGPLPRETFSPHEGVTAPQAQYLFVILERIPDEPQHRRPQANEQGPALGVSPLLLIHCLGPYP